MPSRRLDSSPMYAIAPTPTGSKPAPVLRATFPSISDFVTSSSISSGQSARRGQRDRGRLSPGGNHVRPSMVVHADFAWLAGSSESGTGEITGLGPIAQETARRLACDAKIIFSLEGTDGSILDQKRPPSKPDGVAADRDRPERQGMSISELLIHGLHGSPPCPSVGEGRRDQSIEPAHAVRPSSPCRA